VDKKFLARLFPLAKFISAKLFIATFFQGIDEPFYEAWP